MSRADTPETPPEVPLWALNVLTKRVGAVEKLERAKVLERRSFRKSAIVYTPDAAFYVSQGLLRSQVVRLDGQALDTLAAPVAVDCPSCGAGLRLHNFEPPGDITCAACATPLRIDESLKVSKRPSPRKAPTGKRHTPTARGGLPGLTGDFSAIRGIGPKYTQALHRRGVSTYKDFIATDPEKIAAVVGISLEQAQEYQDGADLTRVTGLGDRTADLMRSAGVRTLWELAEADANALADKLNLVKRDFGKKGNRYTRSQIAEWVSAAKKLVR